MGRGRLLGAAACQVLDGGELILGLLEEALEAIDGAALLDHHGIELLDGLLGVRGLAFERLEPGVGLWGGHRLSSCVPGSLAVLSYGTMAFNGVGPREEKRMFVVAGESLIDLVAKRRRSGDGLAFAAHPGGSPYNCARALGHLGIDTGFLCPISRDGFGDVLLAPLQAAGVTPLLSARSARPTTLAVTTPDARGLPHYTFYREGTAERDLDRAALIAALPERVNLFQMGGFLPIAPDDAAIWIDIVDEAVRRNALLSIDPNVRPSLIDDFAGYKERLSRFLDQAHVVKLSDEDVAALDPGISVEAYARHLLARPHCRLVVVTRGEAGSVAFTRSARAESGTYRPARFGDTVGAGDSLMAGVLAALADKDALSPAGLDRLSEANLAAVLEFGAVVAGLNCGHVGCHPTSRAEVEAVLATR